MRAQTQTPLPVPTSLLISAKRLSRARTFFDRPAEAMDLWGGDQRVGGTRRIAFISGFGVERVDFIGRPSWFEGADALDASSLSSAAGGE